MNRSLGTCLLAAALAAAGAVGCAAEPEAEPASDALLRDDLLVPIPRELDAAQAARKQETLARFQAARPGGAQRGGGGGGGGDFYLAIRRSALAERWFWAVYLKELQPYGPSPGTLGTRVVRFREQNGKLYVFDADDRRATSDVFHPDLILDAFPIVHASHFDSLPGSGGYLLIDPAAGQNRYSAVSDAYATDPYPVAIETELSFVQGFHRDADGGRFEQIITAYTDEYLGDPTDPDANELRIAATLGINLRRYTESPAYAPVAAPPRDHYFLGEPYVIPNTSEVAQRAVHWAFHPGMEPVKWVIGREILDLQADPALGGADLVGAIERGIESWNAVLGYPVFTAALASPTDSFADDHVNYLIVDPDVGKGYAYADWRTNPNTGEIRGASVYFGGAFFSPFEDDLAAATTAAAPLAEPQPKPKLPGLAWQGQHRAPLCVRWARAWEPREAPAPAAASLTGAEKLERYIQEVVAHEVGHTLGLRHNFAGSLAPPTSSVMDYNLAEVAFVQPEPGPYDHQAIAYLYGQAAALPTLPFCTDQDTLRDPRCVRFDLPTPDPLHDAQIPDYALYTGLLLDGSLPLRYVDTVVRYYGTELYAFARAGTPAEAADAWQAALDGIRAPLDPAALASNPYLGPAADALSAAIYRELLISPRAAVKTAPSAPAVVAAIAADARAILENQDGARSFPTRRVIVDALERAQTLDAYLALLGARAAIDAQLPGLPPVDQALTRDLLARIDAAIEPYFD